MATVAHVAGTPTVMGNKRMRVVDVTLDSSYPTGGESITATDLRLRKVQFAICNVKAVSGTVNIANAYYDYANQKLKIYDETPAEVANAADLSSCVIQVVAFGY